jgi:four helix bundle protein
MNDERYDLEKRRLEFAARIIRLPEETVRTPAGTHIAQQALHSGTSPLPNHGEAQTAESKRDFILKLKICSKELREAHRWLQLIQRVPLLMKPKLVEPLLQETDELVRIFVTSIKTVQKNALTA